jgi:hypothetical protein
MLIVDPTKRGDCESLMAHPWLKVQQDAATSRKLSTVDKLPEMQVAPSLALADGVTPAAH